jgi:hypothetical protein
MVYACNGFFAILWNFQLQNYGFLTCNFRYFYLTTNKLADKYSVERLEAACKKALSYTAAPSYKSIKNILSAGQDKLLQPEQKEPVTTSSKYGITRGADYYRR